MYTLHTHTGTDTDIHTHTHTHTLTDIDVRITTLLRQKSAKDNFLAADNTWKELRGLPSRVSGSVMSPRVSATLMTTLWCFNQQKTCLRGERAERGGSGQQGKAAGERLLGALVSATCRLAALARGGERVEWLARECCVDSWSPW